MNTRIHEFRITFNLPVNDNLTVERYVNTWAIVGDKVCLVDSGPCGREQVILDGLASLGKAPEEIALVINTHEHPDHIGGNRFFKDKVNPEFACHTAAVPWIEDLERQLRDRPIHGFYTLAGQPVEINRRLEDGDEIDLGGDMTLRVIFTPGHSPGSISLYCPQEKTLIVGDNLQPVGGLPLYLDLAQTRNSLETLLHMPNVEKMYSSCAEHMFEGPEVARELTASLTYLDKVDALAKQAAQEQGSDRDPAEITRRVLTELKLTPPPVMAMTIQSVMSHLA